MKKCPPGITTCGGSWTQRMLLNQSFGPAEGGYGLLYNRFAVDDPRGIYPTGFRTMTSTEFNSFDSFVGTPVQKAYGPNLAINDDDNPRWDIDFSPPPSNLYGLNIYPAGNRRGEAGAGAGTYESFGTMAFIPLDPNAFTIGGFQENSILSTFAVRQYGVSVIGVTSVEPTTETVTDADGNEYGWVLVNGLYWMTSPLKTTHYNNGEPIQTGLDNDEWVNTLSGAYAFPNGEAKNV